MRDGINPRLLLIQALIASSASKRDFEGVKEVTTFVLKV